MRADARPQIAAAGTLPLGSRPMGPATGLQPPVLRMLGWCTAVALIAAALLPLAPRLTTPHAALTLAVSGELARTSAESVREAVAGRLNVDFYELDLAAVRAAVEALPWVARARVERAWPDAVRVHVWEHRAVARWGDHALLSGEGRVFTPDELTADLAALPRLSGPDGREAEVRAVFEALRGPLADTPFAPARLAQNARGEWTAWTADGIELRLGRLSPTDAVALLAGPVRTALTGRLTEVTYVDLHYFNGFAVGWRESADGGARSSGVVPEDRDD